MYMYTRVLPSITSTMSLAGNDAKLHTPVVLMYERSFVEQPAVLKYNRSRQWRQQAPKMDPRAITKSVSSRQHVAGNRQQAALCRQQAPGSKQQAAGSR